MKGLGGHVSENIQEAYEVVASEQVVMNDKNNESRLYKIEVLRSLDGSEQPYRARYYVEERVSVQNAYDKNPIEVEIWVHLHAPWVKEKSLDSALRQSESFLELHCGGSSD